MLRPTMALVLGLIAAAFTPGMAASGTVTEEDAHAIGVEAYLYFYPIVTMDVTRKQFTNMKPGEMDGIGGPMNTLGSARAFPTADMRVVVRPNFDTLYSPGYLDLTKEPMVRLGAGHRRPLLPPAHARHVDGRVRLAGLAHDRYASRQLPRDASRLERHGA